MADDTTYETKTVKTVRGTEGRTAAKWESDGWEVVSQSRGKLQTEITLRRPKPASHRTRYLLGAGAAVIVFAAAITIGALTEKGDSTPTAASTTARSAQAGAPPASDARAHTSASSHSSATSSKTTTRVLTRDNSPELAALLKVTDTCDSSIKAFAAKHAGETIAFDANIGDMKPHGDTSTRYDILIGAGDFSKTEAPGPAFQFRDVNTTFDMHYTQDPPDTIGTGANLHVKATVDEYEPRSCLFRLSPVATTVRP